jgi:hypothetical protein
MSENCIASKEIADAGKAASAKAPAPIRQNALFNDFIDVIVVMDLMLISYSLFGLYPSSGIAEEVAGYLPRNIDLI